MTDDESHHDDQSERDVAAGAPEPGTDSRVEDWFGQSVADDAELADRLTAELGAEDNSGTPYEQDLEGLVRDIEEDSRALRITMAELGVDPSPVKMLVARGSELVSRLKANGRFVTYSPSSRVLEFEGLVAALTAKQQFWRSLAVLSDDVVPDPGLDRLIERAGEQAERVVRLHDRAAATAFAA